MKKFLLAGAMAMALMAGSCDDDAVIATANVKKAGDNFEVYRHIKFYNAMQDTVLLEVEGFCSYDLNSSGTAFSYICKVGSGNNDYIRNTLIRSETVTAFVEQRDPTTVSAYHYRSTFKPQALIGDVDFRGSVEELTTNSSEANQ